MLEIEVRIRGLLSRLPIAVLLLTIGCSQQPDETVLVKSVETQPVIAAQAAESVIALDIYKSPTCGCCEGWVDHAQQRGFSFTTHHPADLAELKIEKGIVPEYQSCHTAVSAEGYLFEGHVPARYVKQFLVAPPADALGLAVPGMPMGSPGMEMGDRFTPYAVMVLKRDGSAELYAQVNNSAQQYE